MVAYVGHIEKQTRRILTSAECYSPESMPSLW